MIVAEIKGGLGNQLFQYAVARRLAELHETELKLDVSWNKLHGPRQNHYLGHFNTQENLASAQEISELRRVGERQYHFDPTVLNLEDNIYLIGYWQSEKYFLEIEPIIRREFTLKNGLEEKDSKLAASILHSNSVSLHVRRADYLPPFIHGVCGPDYYLRCMAYLKENFKIGHIFVFGDDIEWARKSLQLGRSVTYVTPPNVRDNTCRDFYLMSLCKYHILANSTFSWWAAWLCQREDKVVLAPMPWFLKQGYKNEKDLIPDTWVKMERYSMKKIPLFKVFMAETASESVAKVLQSGYIGQGPKVEEFEAELRAWLNNDYVVTVNSATSGEHLALHLLKAPALSTKSAHGTIFYDSAWPGLKEGDEVLAPALTCCASNWTILANRLRIKWVDTDEKTLNMDLCDLARKISPTTKVIVLVHWGGYPVDLDRVREIQNTAKEMYGFRPAVIEDCAHAFGSMYKGKKIGNHGNICSFSFQAIKHMTAVDGGALVLPYAELYKRAKLLRWYGIDRDTDRLDFRCESDVLNWGFKFHMNDVNAAVGLENLKHVDWVLDRHRENARYYNKELQGVVGITLLENREDCESVYWIYSMLVERKADFMSKMKEYGIIASQVHERNDIHTCVREFKSQLPALDIVTPKLICIPVGWWVTKENREYIVDCIKKGW